LGNLHNALEDIEKVSVYLIEGHNDPLHSKGVYNEALVNGTIIFIENDKMHFQMFCSLTNNAREENEGCLKFYFYSCTHTTSKLIIKGNWKAKSDLLGKGNRKKMLKQLLMRI
jgi:hypothetical protein